MYSFEFFNVNVTSVESVVYMDLDEGYSVCSLVVPTLEEAILTSVLKKNFK